MKNATPGRKADHIRLCASGEVEFARTTTLFEDVELVHCALPELSADEVDVSRTFWGKRLAAPLLIGAMTGGTASAERINRDLAAAAAATGIGLQLGSQRAMIEDPRLIRTYLVRDVAPDILLLGNIGLAQARDLTDKRARALVDDIGADGICLHLNAAMEMFQPEGERDFRRGIETIRRFASIFGERLIVKETGCGISREVGRRLVEAGGKWIDVGGAGGTSWVRVELMRSSDSGPFSEWGIPTAASLCELRAGAGRCSLIASGGLRTGVDVAKAIVLGASLAGIALPFLRAQQDKRSSGTGRERVAAEAHRLIRDLKAVCALTGCVNLQALAHAPAVITGRLRDWITSRTKA